MSYFNPIFSLDSSGTAAIQVDTGSLCLDDYINIDGAGSMCQQGNNAVTSGRLCGTVFGGGIAKTIANFGESTACGKFFENKIHLPSKQIHTYKILLMVIFYRLHGTFYCWCCH